MSFMDRWPRRRHVRKLWIALGSLLIGAYVAAILKPPKEPESPTVAASVPAPDIAMAPGSEAAANPAVRSVGPESADRTPPAGGGSMSMVRGPALPPEAGRPPADFGSSAASAAGGPKLKLVRSFMPYQSPTSNINGINRSFDSDPFKQRSAPRPAAGPALANVPMDGDVVAGAPLPRPLSSPVAPLGAGAVPKEAPPPMELLPDGKGWVSLRSNGAPVTWKEGAIGEIRFLREASRKNPWMRLAVGGGVSIVTFGLGVLLSGLLSAILKIDNGSISRP